MDKKIIGLIGGAVSALALLGPARAETAAPPATAQSLAAGSFEELLQPLPNAVSILKAVDEAEASGLEAQPIGGDLTLVQYQYQYQYHHHHHHQYRPLRRFISPHHHHHHHHHHHQNYQNY